MEAGILGTREHFGVLALTLVGASFDLMLKVASLGSLLTSTCDSAFNTGQDMEAGILGTREHFGVLALTLVGVSFDLMMNQMKRKSTY
jgi:hypothetical protein